MSLRLVSAAPLIALSLAAFTLVTTGCAARTGVVPGSASATSKATAAIDAQGNCTSSFINAYNAVVTQASVGAVSSPGKSTSLSPLDSACENLPEGVTCRALVSGASAEVTSQSLSAACSGGSLSTGAVPSTIALEPTAQGNSVCSSAFVSAYTNAMTLIAGLSGAPTPSQTSQIAQACYTALSSISAPINCTTSSGTQISSTTLTSSCARYE